MSSLNDLTRSPPSVDREPIVYNDKEPTRVQTCDDDKSIFPAKPASGLGPVLEKRGSQKRHWWSFHPTNVFNLE